MTRTYQGTFRQLVAWQSAKELAKQIYRLANKFPKEEIYGLVSQLKRASVSVMSNLAEGNQRKGKPDKLNFFNIAYSSLTEIDNQCDLAFDLGYISKDDYEKILELINKTGYLIFRLIESKTSQNNPNNPNHPNNPTGFTLVELMVVITIIALMSVGAVVGFGKMGDTMRTKEAASAVKDIVKKTELEILKEDYKKSKISFSPDYVVITSEPEGNSLNLSAESCTNGYQLNYGSGGNLIKSDSDGNLMEAKTVTAGASECITNFQTSNESGWQYQIKSSPQVSNVIRFVHFNLNRTEPSGIKLSDDLPETITIEAPYAKKTISDTDGEINLTVKSPEGYEETLAIK